MMMLLAFIAILGLSAIACLVAYASLLPFVERSCLVDDLRTHWWIYLTIPACCGLVVMSSSFMVQLLVIILALGALIDRNIAYAPDGCTVPILALCVISSPWFEGMAWYWHIGSIAMLYVSAELLWTLQVKAGKQFITSADILSLGCPLIYFGLNEIYLAFNPVLALVIILLRCSPSLRKLASRPEAVCDARADTGMAGDDLGVTLLTISYPIFIGLLLFAEFVG